VPRALARSGGADITKRAAGRRSRYLFLLPGGLSVTPGARIGRLTGLDTATPVLYIEFGAAAWGGDEVGRLKCWGVLYYPRNAVLTLRGGGKAVICEDVIETVVVFGEWAWVGGAAANPTEAVLPLPDGLAAVVGEGGGADIWPRGVRGAPRRARADGGGAGGGGVEGEGGEGGGTPRCLADEVVDLDDEEEEEEGENDDAVEGGETPVRRASTRKRARVDHGDAGYQEVGSDEDGGEAAEDEGDAEGDSDFVME